MAERRGSGLQSRPHGFESRRHLARQYHQKWAIGAAVARFPDTEEVTGSIPVSPTHSPDYSEAMRLLLTASVLLVMLSGCQAAPTVTECPPKVSIPAYDGSNADSSWFDEAEGLTADFASGLVGMTEDAAERCTIDTGLQWRVVARDGEFFAITADYSPTRVNAVVERGLVTEVTAG